MSLKYQLLLKEMNGINAQEQAVQRNYNNYIGQAEQIQRLDNNISYINQQNNTNNFSQYDTQSIQQFQSQQSNQDLSKQKQSIQNKPKNPNNYLKQSSEDIISKLNMIDNMYNTKPQINKYSNYSQMVNSIHKLEDDMQKSQHNQDNYKQIVQKTNTANKIAEQLELEMERNRRKMDEQMSKDIFLFEAECNIVEMTSEQEKYFK